MAETAFALAMAGIAFMMTVVWGTPFIRVLRRMGISTRIREDAPGKPSSVVPTMGGFLFLTPVLFLTLILNIASAVGRPGIGLSILLPLLSLISFAFVGVLNDIRKDRPGKLYLPGRLFLVQVLLALALATGLQQVLDVPQAYIPFVPIEVDLGYGYIPLGAGVILMFANAVQTTAGVNGLSGLLMATAYASFGAVSALQQQVYITRFCFTVVGALLGFLWFNIKPASLLMGRTGAYALGATLGVVALMTGQWPLLLLIGIIPLVEISSLLLDRYFSRLNPPRPLLLARPLHKHLAVLGWSNTQIIQRYWLVSLLFAMIGISLTRV